MILNADTVRAKSVCIFDGRGDELEMVTEVDTETGRIVQLQPDGTFVETYVPIPIHVYRLAVYNAIRWYHYPTTLRIRY